MTVKKIVQKTELWVLVIMGVAATLIMAFSSLFRYFFNYSWVWSEEAVRILFVWSMFIAITASFIRNEHIGFDALMNRNKVTRLIQKIVYAVCLIIIGYLMSYYGWQYNRFVGAVELAGTGLPQAVFFLPGVIAGIAWVLIGFYIIFQAVRGYLSVSEKEPEI